LQDAPVLIRGSVSGRDRDEDDPPIFLDSAVPLSQLRTNGSLAVELSLPQGNPDAVTRATDILKSSPGPSPLYVMVPGSRNGNGSEVETNGSRNGGGDTVRLRSRTITVM